MNPWFKGTNILFLRATKQCVFRENLNLIRQKIEKLEDIRVEDVKGSNSWKITTPGRNDTISILKGEICSNTQFLWRWFYLYMFKDAFLWFVSWDNYKKKVFDQLVLNPIFKITQFLLVNLI